ncbi:uncharacterized protein LOC34618572 [Cyclospora cayetanensis]|uniref:Uncharacterized protein LOC34618572 n=1 Tax=Cyclospora cayetanensis TaxID=88456 RepID=A0A6P6RSG6_9EIME|nr:uncharacterized protein LOC34618572 [Cyclospora cayetanensis]
MQHAWTKTGPGEGYRAVAAVTPPHAAAHEPALAAPATLVELCKPEQFKQGTMKGTPGQSHHSKSKQEDPSRLTVAIASARFLVALLRVLSQPVPTQLFRKAPALEGAGKTAAAQAAGLAAKVLAASSASSSSAGCGAKKPQVPPLSAPDIALLLRDYASFVQRTERQLQRLQRQVQQEELDATEYQHEQQQRQQRMTGERSWKPSGAFDKTGLMLQQQKLRLEEAQQLRRSVAEGVVVCQSLHARLSSLLLESPSTDGTAVGTDLLLAKLRRDFAQQQQQYSRLLRLVQSNAELLREPARALKPPEEAEAARSSRYRLSVYGSHFEHPQRRKRTASILWSPERGSEEEAEKELDGCFSSSRNSGGIWQHGCAQGLPPLLIGPPSARSAPRRSPERGLWEAAALVEVHEDYEKQQILTERKEQLKQLQQVERCVTALRELQLHVAADVGKSTELLHVAEEQTGAAADHTAAGVGELASAARGKSRWWGVQGGGAAALVGVSVGAIAGGPVGAAVGAVVGAVAGISSGAALRGRHRDRIDAVARSARCQRVQRLKRSSEVTRMGVSAGGVASAFTSSGNGLHVPGIQPRTAVCSSRPLYDIKRTTEGSSMLETSGATAEGRRHITADSAKRSTARGADTARPTHGRAVGSNEKGEEHQDESREASRQASSKRNSASSRSNRRGDDAQPASLRVSIGIPGLQPVIPFHPR